MSLAPLTLVMGVGRSGTTALFRSLARDPRLSSFSEGEGPLYGGRWYLLPEITLRPFLEQSPGPVLTKPLNETAIRGVTDVLDEFSAYRPRLIWIYRDPVNVYHSWVVQEWTAEAFLPFFLHEWNRTNRLLLSALATHSAQITVIRYEDLILDAEVWRQTSERVFIEGHSLFRPDSRAGRRLVARSIQAVIDRETLDVWAELEERRTFRPRMFRRLLSRYGRAVTNDDRQRRARGRAAPAADSVATASSRTASEALTPDQIDGLVLWLDAGDLSALRDGSAVTTWPARKGVQAVSGQGRSGGAFQAVSPGHGRPAVGFPPGPDGDPDGATGGFLCEPENGWRFLHDGSAWTVLVVYRALGRRRSFRAHHILQVSDGGGGEFGIGVTARGADVAAISQASPLENRGLAFVPTVIAAPYRLPERADKWRIVTTVHHEQDSGGMRLTSYAGHRLQCVTDADPEREYPRGALSSALHIGYTSGAHAGPFCGDLAELIIFSSALDERCRTAVVQYLAHKYGLA